MKVKRIFAPDMRQAMKRVRDEIGPDAVIVSNHRIAGGVEVVAAHEQDFDQAQSKFKRDHSVKKRRESQIDLLAAGRKTQDTARLEDQKQKAKNAVLGAQGRGIAQYTQQSQASAMPERDRQIASNYDDELESILASLKKKKDGQRKQSQVPAEEHSLEREPSEEELLQPIMKRGELPAVEQEIEAHSEPDLPEPQGLDKLAPSAQAKSERPRLQAVPVEREESLAENRVIDDMQREIDQLKKMLAGQMPGAYSSRGRSASNNLVADKLSARFEQIGLLELFESRIASQIDPALDVNKAWRRALAKLVDMVPVFKQDFILRSGMIAFVGPTGVGKTTTIGKLAAKYVLENGSAGVALVTTDSYRIAAHEQLKTYGRILDVPVRVVDENNSLADVLASLKNKRLVLIDTAGLGSADASALQQNRMLEEVPL
ncbi:MAG: flagellar biosynthesis protein FlhF, partial [Pseudomonadales bacterium]